MHQFVPEAEEFRGCQRLCEEISDVFKCIDIFDKHYTIHQLLFDIGQTDSEMPGTLRQHVVLGERFRASVVFENFEWRSIDMIETATK